MFALRNAVQGSKFYVPQSHSLKKMIQMTDKCVGRRIFELHNGYTTTTTTTTAAATIDVRRRGARRRRRRRRRRRTTRRTTRRRTPGERAQGAVELYERWEEHDVKESADRDRDDRREKERSAAAAEEEEEEEEKDEEEDDDVNEEEAWRGAPKSPRVI